MFLFVVRLYDPSFLFIFSAKEVFISSLISSKQLFSLVAEAHLIILRCFHKPATSLFLPLLFFKQLRSILLLKDALSNSFMVGDVGFILCSIHSNYITIMLCFRRHGDVALFTHHLELWGSCSFHAYPFNRSVVTSLQVLFILSSFPSSFSRSAAQIISILFLLYLVLTGVVSISILSLNLLVLVVSLVPLF